MAEVTQEVDPSAWRHVHWISPLSRLWTVLVAIVGFIVWRGIDYADEIDELAHTRFFQAAGTRALGMLGPILMFVVLGILLVAAWLAAEWLVTRYALGPDAIHLRHGLVFRSHKRVPYDRIQATDISRPLLARLLGLGTLTVDSAGGSGSKLEIGFLPLDTLEALRREVERRAAGAEVGGAGEQPDSLRERMRVDDRIEGGEYLLFRVPSRQVFGAMCLSLSTVFTVFFVILTIMSGVYMALAVNATTGQVSFTDVAGFIAPLLAAVSMLWARFHFFVDNYDFRAHVTRSGIRISRGLMKTVSVTLAPGRVHGLVITQGLLWRLTGWWDVTLIMAGYGEESQTEARKLHTLLPVTERDDVARCLWVLLPELGVEDPEGLIDAALWGRKAEGGFMPIAPKARILDPLQGSRLGARFTPSMLVTRSGWLTRRVVFLDLDHIQSVQMAQGPVQRALGCASVKAHVVTSAGVTSTVPVPHLPEAQAGATYWRLVDAAGHAGEDEKLADWVQRVLPLTTREPETDRRMTAS